MEYVIEHKDGHQLLALMSGGRSYWAEPESDFVRRYSKEDAENIQALAPFRIRKHIGRVRPAA